MHPVIPRALALLALLAAAPHAAGAQTRLNAGTTAGRLGDNDGQAGGRYYDEYRYVGRRGERLRIELWSTRFDPYLVVWHRGVRTPLASNDNIDQDNRSSRIIITLPADTVYVIRVTSSPTRPRATGRYQLSLQSDSGPIARDDPPRPPTSYPAPPPPPPATRQLSVCVVLDGELREVSALYNSLAQDTTYNGQPFSVAFPLSGYGAGAEWYLNNEPIRVNGRTYAKFSVPRVLHVTAVTRLGEYRGVPVFVERGMTGTPEVIYVPVRPGCEFQPYEMR